MSYEDIHANLASGQRGSSPDIEPDQVQAIVSSDAETRLSLENDRLKVAMVEAKSALQKAETDLAKLREVEDKTIRLEAQLEAERMARQQLAEQQETHRKELQAQIALLQEQVKELALQAGREYAKGFIEGISNRNGKVSE